MTAFEDRPRTRVDTVADAYVDTVVALSPTTATYLGLPGDDAGWDDFSPDGLQERADAASATLRTLAGLTAEDDVDRVTLHAMQETLGLEVEIHDAGLTLGSLNVIASPLQEMRMTFDLMPTRTEDDWAVVARRLAAVPDAMEGYVASLRAGVGSGRVSAIRQVEKCIDQARDVDTDDGPLARLLAGGEQFPALRADLDAGLSAARGAFRELAAVLAEELAPVAPPRDAVGREEYALWSRLHVGISVDLDETYAWGLEELDRIVDEQQTVAQRIRPGATVDEAFAILDADPDRRLHGKDALRSWMQELADRAVDDLAGTHFDIPDAVRTIECMIAPAVDGGIYYTGPSDDFTRPGRMWWSVPEGVEEFNTWREISTVYHEGVPGHHLQIAQTVYRRGLLNRWRRLLSGNSGHLEGWALYAERLMAELGYLDEPGDLMGMLDGQRLRAARVVLDIGVHLGLPAPDRWGGGTWDADKAWPFLLANAQMDKDFLAFEFDRYLGWPGQAPSYKIGERLWRQLRVDAEQQAMEAGTAFDLKAFHRTALDVGSVGMDTLRRAVLGTP